MAALTQLGASASDYTTYLTAERGFTEVTSLDGIIDDANYCYLLTAAEDNSLFVGIGRYEAKPGWAGEDTKALRYRQFGDPLANLSNFFTIEKEDGYIGLRNVYYHTSLFQTHDNAGYMYVLTYTEPTMSEWTYLIPTYQNGYWLFENGKYPAADTEAQWKGFMGPWNNQVKADEPIALNRLNTTGDEAGHYRLWRISRTDLLQQMKNLSNADVTWKITNPSFETGDETGWTLNGKDPNGNDEFKTRDYGMSNKDGNYLMNAYQWWAGSLSVSQTVENIPSGEYSLSGVVCTWENRTVTLSGNTVTSTVNGINDATGIPTSVNVTIGTEGTLNIKCESTAQWWVEGHGGETQTFFKLDDVQLHCTSLFLDGMSVPLPNNTTKLVPGQWYYYDISYNSEYILVGSFDNMVYSTDGDKAIANISTSSVQQQMTLDAGRYYFKTTDANSSLVIAPYRNVDEGTFTAVALNVDGLPNSIMGITLNEDGPGSDGTKLISKYLASKGYDFIGCSEDFNYNGSLMESLNGSYSCGTIRKTLSVGGIFGGFPFDTDGLNLIWKNSTCAASNESWTRWNDRTDTDGNQYVKKGYRHYDMLIDGSVTIDVYVLHMDAGDATSSREGQWRQLASAINNADASRPKLIIGDTNSRWTREDITANFMNLLNNDLTASDVWVEFARGGVYPTVGTDALTDQSDPTNYTNYEIVDKIIYINPKAANTVQLVPQSFKIEQDYTYGTVEGTDNTTALGDHKPVVVTFKYQKPGEVVATPISLTDAADNTTAISNANGLYADVTLSGRTLYKDDSWNTLCLPFSMTADQVSSQLAPAELKELDKTTSYEGHVTGVEGSTLYLNFKDASAITAGKPYLIKWAASNENIVNPVFTGVTVNDGDAIGVTSSDGKVTFQGTYAPVALTKDDKTKLYLDDDNTLNWANADGVSVNAFRAYFLVPTNSTARQFVLNFGDGNQTAIDAQPISDSQLSTLNSCDVYDLQGRRVNSQMVKSSNSQVKKGLYIHNGTKVLIRR